jgi:hypothetical protein
MAAAQAFKVRCCWRSAAVNQLLLVQLLCLLQLVVLLLTVGQSRSHRAACNPEDNTIVTYEVM